MALFLSYAAFASRNSTGTYSLPNGPVVSGTSISSTNENSTRADLATEITNSLDRNGRGPMLAPLQLSSGTVSAPSLTFAAETNSGWYRLASHDFGLSINGVTQLECVTTVCIFSKSLTVNDTTNISAATTNGDALTTTGNGTGNGLTSTGGANGHGIVGTGGAGATGGDGVRGYGGGAAGGRSGVYGQGNSGGAGGYFAGGAGGYGAFAVGNGAAAGVNGNGSGTAGSGPGGQFTGGLPNGPGLIAVPQGAGLAVDARGPAKVAGNLQVTTGGVAVNAGGLQIGTGGLQVGTSGTTISASYGAFYVITMGTVNGGTCVTSTQTLTGVSTTGACYVSTDQVSGIQNVVFDCQIAANSVRIRACNISGDTGASHTLPPLPYYVRVFQP